MPAPPSNEAPLFNDKLVHFSAFSGLALLALWSYGVRYLMLAGLIAYGLATETGQAFIPSRSFEWLDFAADTAGVLLASSAYLFFLSSKRKEQ